MSRNRIANPIKKFHNDERGVEALEAVLLIAIAAILLFFIAKVAAWAMKYTSGEAQKLKD